MILIMSAALVKLNVADVHCVSKKLCQILTDFQNFCTTGKHMKFATKPIQYYPPHLRQVATLPWEIKKLIFVNIQQTWKKIQSAF